MLSDAWPTPAKLIGELLKSHPEAESLFAEADFSQALAASSAVDRDAKFRAAQIARCAYEELRHRLEPRRGRPVHFAAGMLFLAVLGAVLFLLDLVELGGVLPAAESRLLALGATAVWVTFAWLAVIAARRRRWDLAWAIAGNAIAFGLLLVARYDSVPSPGGGIVASVVCALLLVLTGGAAALLAHMEPASLLVARWRWHRARAEYERVVRLYEADREAAAIARQAWLGLVRSCVTPALEGEEHLVAETVVLAADLLASSMPMLPG